MAKSPPKLRSGATQAKPSWQGAAYALCLSIWLLFAVSVFSGCSPRDTYWTYGECTFQAQIDDEFSSVQYTRVDSKSKWQFEYETLGKFSPDDITIDQVSAVKGMYVTKDTNGDGVCELGYDRFRFAEGKLIYASFRHRSDDSLIGVSDSRERTILRLPARAADLKKRFGQPDKVASTRTSLR
jgi:hypothetical protein